MKKAKQIPDWCISDPFLCREMFKEHLAGITTRYSGRFKTNLLKKKSKVIKLKQP